MIFPLINKLGRYSLFFTVHVETTVVPCGHRIATVVPKWKEVLII